MEKKLIDFISNMEKAESIDYENYEERNIYINKGLDLLYEIEESAGFIRSIFDILNSSTSFVVWINVAGFLRKYESNFSKQIYKKFYVSDVMIKYLYDNWDVDEETNFKNRTLINQEKIEKYNNWKEENREEYEKIMLELNKIIEKL